MLKLNRSLLAWGAPEFEAVFKAELARHRDALPLQRGLAHGSTVADTPVTVLFQRATEAEGALQVKAGIFYEGLLGGCACANDPTPESPSTEYCEVEVEIDRATGAAKVRLLED